MLNPISASLFDLVLSISNVVDLFSPDVNDHHARVASASLAIAREMHIEDAKVQELVLAALLHDIGIISADEHTQVLEYDSTNVNAHAHKGWVLLHRFRPLTKVAHIIRHHHVPWLHHNTLLSFAAEVIDPDIHLAIQILHLADRLDTIVVKTLPDILCHRNDIVSVVTQDSGKRFSPSVVDAFVSLSKRDSFWLDLASPHIRNQLASSTYSNNIELDDDDLLSFAAIMARVIDFRCSFTATHSCSVAEVSELLATMCDLSSADCRKVKLAGYLHDIGKLAIPREIIEKAAALDRREYDKIRTHVYYTRQILQHIVGFEEIVTWASQHHERLDGSGYPDCATDKSIPLGSRIIAVADVFTALSEKRPYRKCLSRNEIMSTLREQSELLLLDNNLVTLILENVAEFERHRLRACNDIAPIYRKFVATPDRSNSPVIASSRNMTAAAS